MATKEKRKQHPLRSSQETQPRMIQPAPALTISDEELYERVAQRAYQLYQERGEKPGDDLTDWLTAEQLVKAELLHGPVPEEPLEVER